MQSNDKWYLKNSNGKVFGPITLDVLASWARDGRVEPFAGVSQDLRTWSLASMRPELEMDWIIENEPGRFYGPIHRAVVDDLIKQGGLTAGRRIYRDDHDGKLLEGKEAELAAARESLAKANAETEKALAGVQTVRDEQAAMKASLEAEIRAAKRETADAMAETAKAQALAETVRNEAARTVTEMRDAQARELAAKDAALAQKDNEINVRDNLLKDKDGELAAKDREIELLKEQVDKLTETHQRTWEEAEVVVPEVVTHDEPPPVATKGIFKGQSQDALKELERQAQAEIARMRASGSKGFFRFGR